MPPQISLQELYKMKKDKDNIRTVCFDRVIELCHRRIRNIGSYGGLNTFFEIPGMLLGYPLYNIYECLDYVVNALRKSGFLVQILPPPHVCVIYISWNPDDLKAKNKQKAIMPPPRPNSELPYPPPSSLPPPTSSGFQMPSRFITKTDASKRRR